MTHDDQPEDFSCRGMKMNRVQVKRIPTPPNLKAYQEKFGHRQSPEASRSYSLNQLDQMAKQALERGAPIPQWRDRSKKRLGNVNDQKYKNLQTEKPGTAAQPNPKNTTKSKFYWGIFLAWSCSVLGLGYFIPNILFNESHEKTMIGYILFGPIYVIPIAGALFLTCIICFFVFSAFDATIIESWKKRSLSFNWILKFCISICAFSFLVVFLIFSGMPEGIPRVSF